MMGNKRSQEWNEVSKRWREVFDVELDNLYNNKGEYESQIKSVTRTTPTHQTISELEGVEIELQSLDKIIVEYQNVRMVETKAVGGLSVEEVKEKLDERLARDWGKIKELVQLKQQASSVRKELVSIVQSEFDTAYGELEGVSETEDLKLLEKKRVELDNSLIMYLRLNNKMLNRKMKKYYSLGIKRLSVLNQYNKLEKLYRDIKASPKKDSQLLTKLVKDCQSIASDFKKIRYYEGNLEAISLKDEIGDYLMFGEVSRNNEDTSKPAEVVVTVNGTGYFPLPALPEPSTSSPLYDFWQIYMGKTGEGWLDRLNSLERETNNVKLTTKKELEYIEQLTLNLKAFANRGYLATKIGRHGQYREATTRVFNALESLTKNFEMVPITDMENYSFAQARP